MGRWFCLASLVVAAPVAQVRAEEGRPKVERLLVMPLETFEVDENLGKSLTAVFTAEFRKRLPESDVVTERDLINMLELQATRQTLCEDDSCIAEVAGALGADHVASGSLGMVGDTFIINLQLLDSRRATIVSKLSRDVTDRGDLPRLVREWARALVDPDYIADEDALAEVGIAVGTVNNALRAQDGVGFDAELSLMMLRTFEVAAGVSLPDSYPISLRVWWQLPPVALGLTGRATAFVVDARQYRGEVKWSFGVGVAAAYGYRTYIGDFGVRLEGLYSHAPSLGAAIPVTAVLFWRS